MQHTCLVIKTLESFQQHKGLFIKYTYTYIYIYIYIYILYRKGIALNRSYLKLSITFFVCEEKQSEDILTVGAYFIASDELFDVKKKKLRQF